jgi:hypothetical protein
MTPQCACRGKLQRLVQAPGISRAHNAASYRTFFMVSSRVLNDDAFPDAFPGVGIFMRGRGR